MKSYATDIMAFRLNQSIIFITLPVAIQFHRPLDLPCQGEGACTEKVTKG